MTGPKMGRGSVLFSIQIVVFSTCAACCVTSHQDVSAVEHCRAGIPPGVSGVSRWIPGWRIQPRVQLVSKRMAEEGRNDCRGRITKCRALRDLVCSPDPQHIAIRQERVAAAEKILAAGKGVWIVRDARGHWHRLQLVRAVCRPAICSPIFLRRGSCGVGLALLGWI